MSTHSRTTATSSTRNAGVIKLFKDIYSGGGGSHPQALTQLGDRLYFTAADPAHGSELWVSDGTPSGTHLLKDLYPGTNSSIPTSFTNFLNQLYFSADDGVHGQELWQSDGTGLGTHLFKDIDEHPPDIFYGNSNPTAFVQAGNKLYFKTEEGALVFTTNLWVTDGTTTGTQQLIGGNDILFPKPFTEFQDKLYFSDMTAVGVIDPTSNAILWSKPIGNPKFPTEFGGRLYFSGTDSLYGEELWVSDGTAAGTQLVKDISSSSSSPSNFTVVGDKLYFSANDDDHGRELWVSDGTVDGTQLVKDINPSGHSFPLAFAELGGKLYFTADDGIYGNELWVSDGTTAGTQLVKDINPSGHSNPVSFENPPLFQFNNKLYFTADDGTHGRELWVSDGTPTGTRMLQDINLGRNGSNPANFTQFGGRLYFEASDGVHGNELWVLDPQGETVSGTPRRDVLDGAAGDDTLLGLGGNDTLIGGNGEDSLDGGIGNDMLIAGNGDDRLYGSTGNDRLLGGAGQDLLVGGVGYNVLVGNQERDTFVLHRQGFALIRDFALGSDRLSLPRGVHFRDLDILQQGNASILEVGDRSIAKLLGVLPSALRASSFI
ncbi:MAG: hypothetical protein SFY66_02785 [Oculatellaceae cyanobacterium bins.114]|nr:hypothetical protein [Oculatellaceae cyanobacterium bins.114]